MLLKAYQVFYSKFRNRLIKKNVLEISNVKKNVSLLVFITFITERYPTL